MVVNSLYNCFKIYTPVDVIRNLAKLQLFLRAFAWSIFIFKQAKGQNHDRMGCKSGFHEAMVRRHSLRNGHREPFYIPFDHA